MTNIPIRRRFSRPERRALYLNAGGFCEQCGSVLEQGWHADHRKPFASGGDTDVANGAALCPKCNLRKGTFSMQQREWQERFLLEREVDLAKSQCPKILDVYSWEP